MEKKKLICCCSGISSSFRTPPFTGHKIWSRKNVHIFFAPVTSIIKDNAVYHLLQDLLPEEVDSLLSHAKGFVLPGMKAAFSLRLNILIYLYFW